ncbi:response regulator transcription factor [Bradyrhizobium sp. AUGA SZCCT0240]|uniref:helix-turn-helix transcriptional regulator n=1 Tax=unclassified Bradyrhizobium TaxID=2631580 RepID=UPI001BA963EE|nr:MULTISPECIES: LuxR C-terminal-related transcriptional regulator [unclassified Bradyrhizobium]MBR1241573.1 response regulator transcription factor [Bradyrhizobium sp. AUGA SZCCT0274]MBR1254687.1 response regulator transcription factor [Bradyrhizobium sp. AUGA SZCCT0240]
MAVSTKALLETVDQIYLAGCDPARWPEVVASCQSLFPGTAFSFFISLDGLGHDPISTTTGWDPDWIRQYFEHFHKLNPFNDLLRSNVGQVVRESHLVSRDWLERQPFYQEWLKPAGNYTHGANLTLARDSGSLARLSIDIPERFSHLEAPATEFLQRVGSHFLRAFALTSCLHAARVAEAGLQGLLDRVSGAAFLVHQPRKVVAVNQRAVVLLEQGLLLRISPASELMFAAHHTDEKLRHALQSAFASPTLSPANFTVMNGSSKRYAVLVLPFRTSRTLATVGADRGLALVLINDRRRAPVPPSELLKSLYGLSHAEANVVLRITEGNSMQTAADRLGICRATARNQLAAAMAKLGVHRQAELVGVVAAVAPRLDLDPDE